MNRILIAIIPISSVSFCAGTKAIDGHYELRGNVGEVSSLDIGPGEKYVFCTQKCVAGRQKISFREGSSGRVVFIGKELEGYLIRLGVARYGERYAQNQRPWGGVELTYSPSNECGTVLDVMTADGIYYCKINQ